MEVLIDKRIHRAGLTGGARCGATGRVRLSFSGAKLLITCPECTALDAPKPDRRIRIDPDTLVTCIQCGQQVARSILTGNWNHVEKTLIGYDFIPHTVCRDPDTALRCTVHAAPDCWQPDGFVFDGVSDVPRVECDQCYAVLSR